MLSVLYLLVVGGGVVLLLIVAMIVLPVMCCKQRNRRGGHNLQDPVPVSASEPTAETNTQESTFTEDEPVPAPRNVDVDGVESPLESVSHHAIITYEVFIL